MVEREREAVRVAYAAGPSDGSPTVPEALSGASDVELRHRSGLDDAPDAVADADCLVLGGDLESAPEVVRAVHEAAPDLPVVLAPPEPDPRWAADALRAGATDYLPLSVADGEELLALVREAADRYDRRREQRRDAEMFRALLGSAPMSVYFKDTEGRFVAASDSLREGIDGDPIGKTDVELWGDSFGESALEAHEDDLRVIETGQPIFEKVEHHDPDDDEEVWVRTTKLPWRDEDGEIRGLIGIAEDISEFKRRERELEAQARRLEAFASFASHDLRNPIGIAQGYLDLVADAEDPREAEDALQDVERALSRMEGLIDDLLTMVRPMNEDRTTDLVELDAVVDECWAALDAEGGTLHNEVPPGTAVDADEGQLRQLLTNLLRNSIEHGSGARPDGSDVQIVVGVDCDGFYVADDGPGIDPEDREDIFEYGHSDGGTGVGLAIVREVAEVHDWTVSASESADGGARFDVENCPILTPRLRRATEGVRAEITDAVDVGEATPPGEATAEGDRWTVRGGGRDVWSDIDEHHFAFATLEPPVRVVATLADLEWVHEYTKAGVMVRDGERAGEPFGYAGLTADQGTEFGWRPDRGEPITTWRTDEYLDPPQRYRLDYVDGIVTGYVADGDDWSVLDQRAVPTEGPVAAGIAVCSHDPEQLCEAVFEDVRVVELRPGSAPE